MKFKIHYFILTYALVTLIIVISIYGLVESLLKVLTEFYLLKLLDQLVNGME